MTWKSLLPALGLLAACTLSEPPPQPDGQAGGPGTNSPGGAPGGPNAPGGGAPGAPNPAGGGTPPGGTPPGGAGGPEGGAGGPEGGAGGGTPPGSQPGSMAGAGGPDEPKLQPKGPKACTWTPETEKRIAGLTGVDAESPAILTGTFGWEGRDGPGNRPVLLEVLVYDDSDAISTRLSAVCDRGSDIHLELPGNTGKIQMAAFLDLTGNGPDDTDPMGRTTAAIEIGTAAVSDVALTISTSGDLGDLKGLIDGSGGMPRGG